MSSSYRNSLNEWLSQLDVKTQRVLDIGGSQEPVKGRTRSWDVQEYLIADLANPHKGSPQPDTLLDLNYRLVDQTYEFDSYEMIFCLEVFDYIFNPWEAFNTIVTLLKPGGTAWVTFPSVYPLHQPIEDDALRYFPGGIFKLAESVGLTVEQMIKRRPETTLWQQFYRAERMRAAKHEDHNFTGFICQFKK